MKILHTADLHLGQIIYQNYERGDEHRHFFAQLKEWCKNEKPDALLVSGDVFDIQQPSAATKKAFTEYFADLHGYCPDMHIVITAGNHDSASRLQADSAVWEYANTNLVGVSPAVDADADCLDNYIVRLQTGYIVAMPYMIGERKGQLQSILDRIAAENTEAKPVVMMGHTAVDGLDTAGHTFDIGTLKVQDTASFGTGYDYLALGHIHKPQTIGHIQDAITDEVTYQSPVIRYSGSVLHVSCDEAYPHTVSLVEIDRHGGNVKIKQLRIDELRHFYVLPVNGKAFVSADEALNAVSQFVCKNKSGYIRMRIDSKVDLPPNFSQMIYDILSTTNDEVRYNPNILWEGKEDDSLKVSEKPKFDVVDLQEMKDPLDFIRKTIDQYPSIDINELELAFAEVRDEIQRINEEEQMSKASKKKTKAIVTEEEINQTVEEI